jgi:2-dehydropantoate 2-reductase
MRITVMGTGGVGGFFGGLLARSGQDVVFIARGAHLEAIKRAGLKVASDLAGEFTVSSSATDDTGTVGPVDLVLYTVKMYHNDAAIPAVAPMVGPDTIILTLQNGIDNADRLVAALGKEHVMLGVVMLQGRVREPGVVEQLGQVGQVIFGEMESGITPRGQRLLRVFEQAGWNVELSDNALGAVWRKFIYLAGSAGINAATRVTYGEMRTLPETRVLLRTAYEEVIRLANAKGAPVDDDVLDWCMTALDNYPEAGMASLAKDFTSERRVELEGLMGTVVRMGEELDVPTPVNSFIYAILKPVAVRIEQAQAARATRV